MKWKEPEIINFGKCKIIINRPDLKSADKARIERSVQTSLESVMRGYMYRKEKQHGSKDASGTIS